MSINLKKRLEKTSTFIPKNVEKHKHNYVVDCVLEVTNKHEHPSCNHLQMRQYYNVLKCELCDSFRPKSEEGNYDGHIFKEEDINKSLPLIKASIKAKCPAYEFCELYDVIVTKFEK